MADGTSELQILVSLQDDVSAAMDSMASNVEGALDQLSSQSQSAAEDVSASLNGINVGATGMANGISSSVISATASENLLTQIMNATSSEVVDSLTKIVSGADQAAAGINSSADDIDASYGEVLDYLSSTFVAGFQATMTDVESSAATAATQLTADGEAGGSGFSSGIAKIGAGINAVGMIAGDIAAPMQAFTNGGIAGAQQYQTQLQGLTTQLTDLKTEASTPGSTAYTTQVKDLTDQINALIAKNGVYNTVGHETNAQMASNAAQATLNGDAITKLKDQLDQLNSVQQMAGANVGQISSQYETLAAGAAKYGFTQQDALAALTALDTQTHNSTDTLNDYQVVLDLAASKGWTLSEAAQNMAGAFSGTGKQVSLATGVIVADGLSSQQVFKAVGDSVDNAANNSLANYATQQAALSAKMNDFETNALMPILPMLTQLVEDVSGVITKIEDWTTNHKQLTTQLVEFMIIFGGLLAGIAVVAPQIAIILISLGLFGVALGTAALVITGVIAVIALIVAAIVIWMNYHNQIVAAIKTGTKDIGDWFAGMWTNVKTLWDEGLKYVENAWTNSWNTISTFVQNIWTQINGFVKAGINDLISGINVLINGLDSLKINIPAIGVGPLKTPAINWSLDVPDIPLLAAGGIVSSPTMAIVGDAGPEAIIPLSQLGAGGIGGVGSGGQTIINVNINGGNYMDQSAAKMFSDIIAKTINQQVKLRTT
jgi:hypothetical protein